MLAAIKAPVAAFWAAVPVAADDTASSLHARIQVQEHALLPLTIDAIARRVLTLGPVPDVKAAIDPAQALISPRLSRS